MWTWLFFQKKKSNNYVLEKVSKYVGISECLGKFSTQRGGMKFYLAWDRRTVSLGQPMLGSKTVSANKGKQCSYINHFSSLGKYFNLSHVSSAYFTSMLQGWCENSSIPSLNSHCCYWMHPFLKVIRLLNIVNISVKKKNFMNKIFTKIAIWQCEK